MPIFIARKNDIAQTLRRVRTNPPRQPGSDLGERDAAWRHTDTRSLLQSPHAVQAEGELLQRTIGNQAAGALARTIADRQPAGDADLQARHARGCGCGSCQQASAQISRASLANIVQLARTKQKQGGSGKLHVPLKKKKKKGPRRVDLLTKVALENKLQDAMDETQYTNKPAYAKLSQLFEMVDEGISISDIQQELSGVAKKYNVQALGGKLNAPHPSGAADASNILFPQYTAPTVRSNMYPSNYWPNVRQARDDYPNKHPGKTKGTWRCPGNGVTKPHDADATYYVGEPTIDHRVECATHWNKQGYDQAYSDREAWYNDMNNHDIVCRSCNSSKGSGGVFYRTDVGPNFSLT